MPFPLTTRFSLSSHQPSKNSNPGRNPTRECRYPSGSTLGGNHYPRRGRRTASGVVITVRPHEADIGAARKTVAALAAPSELECELLILGGGAVGWHGHRQAVRLPGRADAHRPRIERARGSSCRPPEERPRWREPLGIEPRTPVGRRRWESEAPWSGPTRRWGARAPGLAAIVAWEHIAPIAIETGPVPPGNPGS